MITELTDAQKARFPEFVDKWTQIGLSTEPANRPMADEAIRKMYAIAGLESPKIVWCSSPLANGLAQQIIVTAKGASVGDSVWASVGDSVRASVRASVWDSVRASVRASVWDSVWASVRDSVGDSVGDSVYGQHEAYWLSFYNYFAEVCGLTKETAKIAGLIQLAQSAGWLLPYKNFCFVSERHNVLKRDPRGRLHCDDGIALAYPDGWGIYALHGVRVKPEYVLTPAAELKPETILAENNAEVRMALIRKVGLERLVSYGAELNVWGEYKLLDMKQLMGNQKALYLLMHNPSTGVWHLEGVPNDCTSVKEALHRRKPAALQKIPIDNEHGKIWYQQGDVCIWDENAITVRELPTVLT